MYKYVRDMGAWGTFEHENDKFADFINGRPLPRCLARANAAELVGIFNLMRPKSAFPSKYLRKCRRYLERALAAPLDPGWVDAAARLAALKSQLAAVRRETARRH